MKYKLVHENVVIGEPFELPKDAIIIYTEKSCTTPSTPSIWLYILIPQTKVKTE